VSESLKGLKVGLDDEQTGFLLTLTNPFAKVLKIVGVTISDRRKSECRWNYTLFDSSYHQSHRLHINHMLKYPSIRENER
jgi:hypothetical protein